MSKKKKKKNVRFIKDFFLANVKENVNAMLAEDCKLIRDHGEGVGLEVPLC